MNSRTKTGIVTAFIGACVSSFGYYKFAEAKSMMKAIKDGYGLFGGDFSSSLRSWGNWADTATMYGIALIIGIIILVTGAIICISGISKGGYGK